MLQEKTDSTQTVPVIIEGKPSITKNIPIDIPVIFGNRKPIGIVSLMERAFEQFSGTDSKFKKEYLQNKNNKKVKRLLFNWNLWRKPFAVEIEESIARAWLSKQTFDTETSARFEKGFINGKFYLLFDGGHRREIYTTAYPNETHWDCEVYTPDSIEQSHSMFTDIQDKLMSRLSRGLLMFQSLAGGDAHAKRVDKDLFSAGLVNQANDEAIHPVAYRDDLSRPAIVPHGFVKTTKLTGSRNYLKVATDCIVEAFENAIDPNERFEINQYVYYGVVYSMINSPQLANTHKHLVVDALKEIFRKCIKTKCITGTQQVTALKLAIFEHLKIVDNVTPAPSGFAIYKAIVTQDNTEELIESCDTLIDEHKNKSIRQANDKLNQVKKLKANTTKQLEVA